MNNDVLSSQPERVSLTPCVSLSAQDDVSLLRASQQGDQEAFALLVRKYQRPLFTLAWSLVQDEEKASVITQDTFLAAWKALPSWPGDADILLWLSRLAYQQCLHPRKQRKPEHGLHTTMDGAYRRERPQPQTLSAAEYLPHLPTISRVVVVLRYLHQRTYEEIALVLSLPIHTIKIYLFGARTFLKEQMQVHHLSASHARGCEREMQMTPP